jgi:hypothetical protein
VGSFDVVLFLGIFYHLVDPIRVLQNIAPIATESLVIETHLDLQNLGRPAMAFYPGKEVNNDPTNWWGPNREAMESLLRMGASIASNSFLTRWWGGAAGFSCPAQRAGACVVII